MTPFQHILVPVDFGVAMDPALDLALSLARGSNAQVTLLHAFDVAPFMNVSPFMPPLDTEPVLAGLEKNMKTLREKVAATWPKTDSVVRAGNVYDVIVDVAKKGGCDLIVIGTHGRQGVSHALLGSVAEKVVRLAPVPVLTVRPAPSGAKTATAA
jgi:nucleotide-binding universal stress UspA family protein